MDWQIRISAECAPTSDYRRTHCGTGGSREPHPHLVWEGGLQAPQDLGEHGCFAPSRDARSRTGSSRPQTWELPSRTSSSRWKRSCQGNRRCAQDDACYLPNTQALSCHIVGLRPVETRDVQHDRICSHWRTKIQPSEHRVHLRFHCPRSQGSSGGTRTRWIEDDPAHHAEERISMT